MGKWFVVVLLFAVATAMGQSRLEKNNPDFPRIANFYGAGIGWKELDEEAVKEVARYDLIVGGCIDVHYTWERTWGKEKRRIKDNIPICEKNIARMRAINPNLLVLPYIDIIEANTKDNPLPDSFYLKDTKGQPIPNWPGCNRVDLTRPHVVDYVLKIARDELLTHDCFDGIFYDCFSTRVSGTNGGDIDTDRDGKRDDPEKIDAVWRENNMRIIRETSQMRGGRTVVMLNTWVVIDYGYDILNGCMGEDQITRVTRNELSFDKLMANYLAWFEKGRRPVITSLCTGSSNGWIDPYLWRDLSKEQKKELEAKAQNEVQMMRFGLTATLMGDGYHAFDHGAAGRGQHWWYQEYDAPLGYPKGPCKKHGDGTWRREYDGGLVVCNPGLYDVEVALGRKMKDVTTDLVVEGFVIPSLDGRIFLPTDAPLSPAERLPKAAFPVRAAAFEVVPGAFGRVLRSPSGLDVWLGERNAVRNVTWNGAPVVRGGSPGVYAPQWKRFERRDVTATHEATERGVTLTSKGTLVCGEQKIAFTEGIAIEKDDHIRITFDAEALTDLDLRMWRHFLALPIEAYAGAVLKGNGREALLPAEKTRTPLLSDAPECEVVTKNVRLKIASSHPVGVVDHRQWGSDEYLLAGYPVAQGKVKQGHKVSCRFDLRVSNSN